MLERLMQAIAITITLSLVSGGAPKWHPTSQAEIHPLAPDLPTSQPNRPAPQQLVWVDLNR